MNFFKFLLYSSFIIFLYFRLKSGPYIYQSSNRYYVNIDKHNFDKTNLLLKRGDTIIFVNKDQIRHTIKNNNDYIDNSPILFQNDIWEVTLNEPTEQIIFDSSLYQNMNKLSVKVEDIFKDSNAEAEFRKNLIEIKKYSKEQKDKYMKQFYNSSFKKNLDDTIYGTKDTINKNKGNYLKTLLYFFRPRSLFDIDIKTVNL